MVRRDACLFAFKTSVPVMMGYLVLGFAFGLLLSSQGLGWGWALGMSVVIYAGALQFAAVGFFAAKLGWVQVAIASLFINIRQAFYGLSLLKKFAHTGWRKPYLIHALTDETYALMTSVEPDPRLKRRWYLFYLALLDQSYWVGGTLAGALFGSMIHFDTRGIDFALTALFVVLAMEQYKARRRWTPFLIGAGAAVLALLTVPMDRMLLVAILLALVGMFLFAKRLDDV